MMPLGSEYEMQKLPASALPMICAEAAALVWTDLSAAHVGPKIVVVGDPMASVSSGTAAGSGGGITSPVSGSIVGSSVADFRVTSTSPSCETVNVCMLLPNAMSEPVNVSTTLGGATGVGVVRAAFSEAQPAVTTASAATP